MATDIKSTSSINNATFSNAQKAIRNNNIGNNNSEGIANLLQKASQQNGNIGESNDSSHFQAKIADGRKNLQLALLQNSRKLEQRKLSFNSQNTSAPYIDPEQADSLHRQIHGHKKKGHLLMQSRQFQRRLQQRMQVMDQSYDEDDEDEEKINGKSKTGGKSTIRVDKIIDDLVAEFTKDGGPADRFLLLSQTGSLNSDNPQDKKIINALNRAKTKEYNTNGDNISAKLNSASEIESLHNSGTSPKQITMFSEFHYAMTDEPSPSKMMGFYLACSELPNGDNTFLKLTNLAEQSTHRASMGQFTLPPHKSQEQLKNSTMMLHSGHDIVKIANGLIDSKSAHMSLKHMDVRSQAISFMYLGDDFYKANQLPKGKSMTSKNKNILINK
jgi:hypothetical protein